MADLDAYATLVSELEHALDTYKAKNALDGRAQAVGAVVAYLIKMGIETRLLPPLVDLATHNAYELANRKGNTKATSDTFRLVAASAAISAILDRAKMGRSLDQIAKIVADRMEGVKADNIKRYRKELMAGRQSRDATKLYDEFMTKWFAPVFEAHPNGPDLERFILKLVEGLAPIGAQENQV